MLVTTLERGGEKMGNTRNSIESNDEFDSGFVVSRGENRYRASRGYRRFNWREIGTRLQIEIAGGTGLLARDLSRGSFSGGRNYRWAVVKTFSHGILKWINDNPPFRAIDIAHNSTRGRWKNYFENGEKSGHGSAFSTLSDRPLSRYG